MARRSRVSIATLLVVVMPLTIVAVALFGMWAMGLSFAAALLLGALLAPTDPVLAGDVGLSEPGGEVYGEPRLSLHTEAGLNDGLASPFVVLGLFVAARGGTDWIGEWLTADLLYGAGVGLGLGAAAGWGAATLLSTTRAGGLISDRLESYVTIGLMLVIYGATEAVGTYGLLAVFAAGFTFRRYEFGHEMHQPVHQAADAVGKALELIVLLMLGTMLTTTGLGAPGLEGWLLAPVLILLIRPALVFATAGRRFMDVPGRLFLAFFGVRGSGDALLRGRGRRCRCPRARGTARAGLDGDRLRGLLDRRARAGRHPARPAPARRPSRAISSPLARYGLPDPHGGDRMGASRPA